MKSHHLSTKPQAETQRELLIWSRAGSSSYTTSNFPVSGAFARSPRQRSLSGAENARCYPAPRETTRGARASFSAGCFGVGAPPPAPAPQTASSSSPPSRSGAAAPRGCAGQEKQRTAEHLLWDVAPKDKDACYNLSLAGPCAVTTRQRGLEKTRTGTQTTATYRGPSHSPRRPSPDFARCPVSAPAPSLSDVIPGHSHDFRTPLQNFSKAEKELCFSHNHDDRL